ncbi:MAG: DUF86 domain-containing protein [Sphingobacteriia bacterium]|nr:DUF86 domain-containing protein [Sphingobacteriia bacterium]
MSKDPIEFLKHILDECSYLISVTKSLSKDEFLADETLKRAVVRSLEIIGEATKKIPLYFKEKWSIIQWKSMAGMRDRLIHDYLGYILPSCFLRTSFARALLKPAPAVEK